MIEELKERIEKSERDTTDINSKIDNEICVKNRDLVGRVDALENKLSQVSKNNERFKMEIH